MTTREDFDVGDVVRLNSSSTRMTVDKIDPDNDEGATFCVWMNDARDLQQAAFHPQQLVNLSDRK
jgi:uncharacterized protein YodC (DUF2158 family)